MSGVGPLGKSRWRDQDERIRQQQAHIAELTRQLEGTGLEPVTLERALERQQEWRKHHAESQRITQGALRDEAEREAISLYPDLSEEADGPAWREFRKALRERRRIFVSGYVMGANR